MKMKRRNFLKGAIGAITALFALKVVAGGVASPPDAVIANGHDIPKKWTEPKVDATAFADGLRLKVLRAIKSGRIPKCVYVNSEGWKELKSLQPYDWHGSQPYIIGIPVSISEWLDEQSGQSGPVGYVACDNPMFIATGGKWDNVTIVPPPQISKSVEEALLAGARASAREMSKLRL